MSVNSQTEFRFLAEPTDVNFGGKVHGGMVMKWIDQASYACAAQWSKRYCVTVSANAIRFIRRILVGQLISCLLYTSPSPRDMRRSRMPSSA